MNVARGTTEPIKPQNHQFVVRVQKLHDGFQLGSPLPGCSRSGFRADNFATRGLQTLVLNIELLICGADASVPTFRAHYAPHSYLREAEQRFEIWTSGSIASDALAKLKEEQVRRVKAKIDWKNGDAVLALARAGKEKALADALNQHFFRHPLAEAAKHFEADEAAGKVPSWMAPTKSNLPEFHGPAIEVVSLDGELDAAE